MLSIGINYSSAGANFFVATGSLVGTLLNAVLPGRTTSLTVNLSPRAELWTGRLPIARRAGYGILPRRNDPAEGRRKTVKSKTAGDRVSGITLLRW